MARVLGLWAPVVAYMAAIFYVSSLSQPVVPPGGDKPWHLLAYLGLGVITVRAVAGGLSASIDLPTAALAISIAVGYAATDEFHQKFVPGRSAQLSDLLADAVGVMVGTGLCWAWGRFKVTRHKPQGTSHNRQGR
jgi:VanZ family protein